MRIAVGLAGAAAQAGESVVAGVGAVMGVYSVQGGSERGRLGCAAGSDHAHAAVCGCEQGGPGRRV